MLYINEPGEAVHDGFGSDDGYIRNPKVTNICPCLTRGCSDIGIHTKYGTDETCPECGALLDWKNKTPWA